MGGGSGTHIETGGGAYIAGGVQTGGGPFVQRDLHVEGDYVGRDKVGGSKTQVGSISGSSHVAVGDGARVTTHEGIEGQALAQLFTAVYQQIAARPEDPDVSKDEIAGMVRQIETEAGREEAANPSKVERWLGFLAGMAHDVWDVTVACLAHPAAGVAEVVRKVARRAREGHDEQAAS
jgi:hypothetical protein